ncbi:MAG: carboxypeptidase-like regulatory domain-containing protein [Terracidiphilus sp.]
MSPALRLRRPAVARLSVLTGLLSFALVFAPAQQPPASDMGRIHGRVINPTGVPQAGGTVSLSTDGGSTLSYNFPVSQSGEYAGQAPAGEYTVVYRAPYTPEGKIADYINEVEVVAGQDTAQDVDMTRQEFIDRLSPEQQEQLREMKKASLAAPAANPAKTAIDADLQAVNRDFEDAENALATASRTLGADSRADIDAHATEIASAKYTEIETLMTKDTAANPGEPALWIYLARAEVGLKDYLDAETSYKKALDLESKAERPEPQLMGVTDAGLGEVYARTLMVDDANAAFNAAVKADPPNAAIYLRNQALIFYEEKNFPAQVDAADLGLKADPNQAILYYIKAEGLAANATVDPDTEKIVLPPGCAEAYRKYLELAPNGPYANQAIAILLRAGEETRPSGASSVK